MCEEKTSFDMFKDWVENTDFKHEEVVSIEKGLEEGTGNITIKLKDGLEIDFDFVGDDRVGGLYFINVHEDGCGWRL